MKKILCGDVVQFLSNVIQRDSRSKEYHQYDLAADARVITEIMRNPSQEARKLFWIYHSGGTRCLEQQKVMTAGTCEHTAWCYYAEQGEIGPAFDIELRELRGGKVSAVLYQLDYPSHAKQVQRLSVRSAALLEEALSMIHCTRLMSRPPYRRAAPRQTALER
ncbi:hypothetical protein [Pseudoflavonifractor phocaeensis]|uniref:hypothetical protein n=1 Tax=Pseudoflavonifractor phocaeensis TaxID=1870988 RepID=UPI0021091979|nr:hypothetical protein [Pseudoflavonifractor phocaeensis]MCQ4866172.1 hypothetical protein [Pseudoflavonifractor phocaeensis]